MTNWNSELLAAVAAMADRAGVDTTTPAAAPDRAFWNALSESGFTGIGIPEDQGGSGGTALDALSVLHAATTRGALTMLLEHSLASRIVAECTGGPATGPATLAFADGRCTVRRTAEGVVLDGTVTGVVHGAEAAVLVIVLPEPQAHPSVALVAAGAPGITVTRGSDLLGAAMDDYTFAGTPVDLHESPHTAADLEERGALAYTVALAAADAAVRDRSVRYAAERTQFGRPLAKFQAVQQRLAGLTALAALLDTATAAAATADTATRRTAIAAAKVVASASAREVAAIGHQIHGALGFTSEHSLGRFTTALWSWRDRYGGERYWSHVLAGQILDDGADPWDLVTGATEPAAAEENAR